MPLKMNKANRLSYIYANTEISHLYVFVHIFTNVAKQNKIKQNNPSPVLLSLTLSASFSGHL